MRTGAGPFTSAKLNFVLLSLPFRRKCETVVKQECQNVTIPEYKVITEVKRERVPVQLPQCKPRFIRDRYCPTFPNGEIECR